MGKQSQPGGRQQVMSEPEGGSGPKTLSYSVTTGAAQVITTPTAFLRMFVQSVAANTGNVYIGDSTVLVASGFELAPGASVRLDIEDASQLYAISAAGGQSLRILGILP